MKTLPERLARLYKTLGEIHRLKILKILASHMEDSLCVNDVSKMLGISQPSASQHLKVLKMMDLIDEHRKGPHVYYTLNLEKMFEYKELIDRTFGNASNKCTNNFECAACPVGDICM